jgi:hypothetical protein
VRASRAGRQLGQLGALLAERNKPQDPLRQRLVGLGVDADGRDGRRPGHRGRPVPGTVRHAAHYAVRPPRGAALAGQQRCGRDAELGQRLARTPAYRTEFTLPCVNGIGDDGLFRREKVRFRDIIEGVRGRHARRQYFLDHDYYRPRLVPLVLDHER